MSAENGLPFEADPRDCCPRCGGALRHRVPCVDVPVVECGAKPPYSVNYIDPEVCGTRTDQWFVMGTVDGDPRNQCGPVAVCEYEPSAHVIAALLNATGGASVIPPVEGGAR